MPMYPSNYKINWNVDGESVTLLLNIYVDDLTLCGDERCHTEFWQRLRRAAKLEPEQFITRDGTFILGRTHYIQVAKDKTDCTLDMQSYADSVVNTYFELTGYDRRIGMPQRRICLSHRARMKSYQQMGNSARMPHALIQYGIGKL